MINSPVHPEIQTKPKNYGEVFIDVFVKSFLIMLGKATWWLLLRPLIWIPLALFAGVFYLVGPYGIAAIVIFVVFVLHVWQAVGPDSYDRLVRTRAKNKWVKFWYYQVKGQWRLTMVDCGMLKTVKMGRDRVPKILKVERNPWRDRVLVELVRGHTIEDIERAAPKIRAAFDVLDVRVHEESGRKVWLVFRFADPLVETIKALPISEEVNFSSIQLGLTDEGEPWTIPVVHQQGAHMLVVATTGAGKSSGVWSLIRGLGAAIRDGIVQVWVADPKGGVEFKRGTSDDGLKSLWYRYADDYESILEMLKEAVAEMDARGRRQAGGARLHEPSVEEPLMLIIIDEILSVTALETNARKQAISALLGKLLTKGRALGIDVIACSQDATKAMLSMRGFFRLRWAGRLEEPIQVDMVLGDGARDRGARCDDHKVIPHDLSGVGFVKVDGVREPGRVRAAYVDEDDIDEMVRLYAPEKKVDQAKSSTSTPIVVQEPGSEIVPPAIQIAEVESWMRFYEEQVNSVEDLELAEEVE